ncbi:hypothetical protein THARTR1_04343 [Trichoderma harzianum]|uniref:Clr5 domain-containing protein n=1 Tax=Trichoderma harzianum TaxID=5544 RepID=A0A2K0UCM7_TRIHA|nr:hypothetical protein THARTR1_04343 [Trichoderma harzianum]
MAWQYPGHSHLNFPHDFDDYDLDAVVSQTSGYTDLITTQSITGDMSFANWQYPTPSHVNEHLTPDNEAPPLRPANQAEIAWCLNGVGGHFDNQPAGDTTYASPYAFSVAAEGGRDTPTHALTNATANGQPPSQHEPHATPPSPQEWEEHKAAIHYFYMEQNLTTAVTRDKMITEHQFHATKRKYKDKFKQWKWSKNLPRSIAARMLYVYIQRWPKRTVFWRNDRMWPIERIKKSLSRHSAQEDSPIQEDSSIPDDFTYGTPPSTGITDTESILENSHGTHGDLQMADVATTDTTEGLPKSLVEGLCRTNSAPEVLYSRVQAVVKAIEEGTCNHEEAESAFGEALSCFSHHYSPTHSKTLEIGYLLASFYAKIGRVNDAYCILDRMTKEHCGDTKSCHDRTVTHVLRTIAILRQTRRDEEANLLTIRLLEYHQTPKADHFLLETFSTPFVGSNKTIEELLASSEPKVLATMSNILGRLSTDSNNHIHPLQMHIRGNIS